MTKEIWRDIAGYEGLYKVSSEGRVKSLKRNKERILKPVFGRGGYLRVGLHAGGKQKMLRVHRLVCQAFCENPNNKPEVNHINEVKTDNRACNLEWVTRKENVNHGTRNARIAKANVKSKSKPVGQYTQDDRLIKVWQSAREAERQAGFSYQHISKVALGKRKTHKGFVWKYLK